uniref:Uncharacterized protein n=1 Tax=Ananas comosus var. bracteatus TaxID=296719 RepID=A0A6V7P532_ANACO|nr:unnamed protein product [Ananas comosus var. bracteatus]
MGGEARAIIDRLYGHSLGGFEWIGTERGSSDWPCSEPFQIFWWVVDYVPTYGTCPEICGKKPCTKTRKNGIWLTLGLSSGGVVPVQGCACTGTRLMVVPVPPSELVPVQSRRAQQPEPRVWISWTLYRYKSPCTGTRGLISCSLNCRGLFAIVDFLLVPPRPRGLLLSLGPARGEEWKLGHTARMIGIAKSGVVGELRLSTRTECSQGLIAKRCGVEAWLKEGNVLYETLDLW